MIVGNGTRIAQIYGAAGHDSADHIASWHPSVALAVADFLDMCADVTTPDDDPNESGLREVLAVATAYLGEI